MNRLALSLLAVLLGTFAAGGWLWHRNGVLRADLAVERAAKDQALADLDAQKSVTAILNRAMIAARARATDFAAMREELADVDDPETCRSPVVDRAFDVLRSREANR
ncbi:hypothetical protein [Aquimixticola soesokkakensis]|uniref:hypothetical protein n=1 Tax=Aquimixticola soesokkakensis TaxID=1519096 RepID=UPI000A26E018|nr:hypothetical protein [Aquimixticola soesokkakensis]